MFKPLSFHFLFTKIMKRCKNWTKCPNFNSWKTYNSLKRCPLSSLPSINTKYCFHHKEAVSKAQSRNSLEKMSAGEREFIFDAVVGFLTSPIWNSPVRTFIEQNSLGVRNFYYIFLDFCLLHFWQFSMV